MPLNTSIINLDMSFWSKVTGGWGASSRFERHRLKFTNKADEGPLNEDSLKNPETRAEIGLAIIVRKLNDSDSNTSWIYLLKNLIILDTALESGLFVQELAELDLPKIYEFKVIQKNYIHHNLDGLIKKYFRLIKFKAGIMNIKNSIFKAYLYNRQDVAKTLNAIDANWHLQQCESLFDQVFDIIQYKEYKIVQFEVVKSVFVMLKNKLISAYSIQMLCISQMLQLLEGLEESDIQVFKKRVLKFNTYAGHTIAFFDENKDIRGFDNLNYKEFNFNCTEVVAYIDEVVKMMKSRQSTISHFHTEELVTQEKLTIVKKIQTENQGKLVPRMTFVEEKKPKKLIFQAYFNLYSEDFPPKELINTEVAQTLKSHKEDSDQDDVALVNQRSNVLSVYNIEPAGHQSSQRKQMAIQYRDIQPQRRQFSNIYSGLQAIWVQ